MVQWLYFVAFDRLPVGIALLLEFTALASRPGWPQAACLATYFLGGARRRQPRPGIADVLHVRFRSAVLGGCAAMVVVRLR